MHQQPLQAQKGEIEFRKKLVRQQVEGNMLLEDEFSAREMEQILTGRMKATHERMASFQNRKIPLAPYVEIGAERGQRSLVMENEIGVSGAAIDLSFDMLASCDHYRRVFKKARNPLRVCCDINVLPFSSGSVPFVFCYQVLHHFPDPGAITREVYRILAPGGSFFFDEEPYKRLLHFNAYKRKIYAKETLNSGKVRKLLDYFFARDVNNEEKHGVIENDALSLSTWKKALLLFHEKEVIATTIHRIATDIIRPKNRGRYLLVKLLGGSLSGLCRKQGTSDTVIRSIEEAIICPSCLEGKKESKARRNNNLFICQSCGKKYPVKEGVLFLFPYTKFAELYPEVFKTIG